MIPAYLYKVFPHCCARSHIHVFTRFPVLNGISIPCLASQGAGDSVRKTFTNIFGGSVANEGLGLLSLSFDWQYLGSYYMSLPLVQQGNFVENTLTPRNSPLLLYSLEANSWIGLSICYVAMAAIYYSNTFHVSFIIY